MPQRPLHGAGVQPHTPALPPPPHFCPVPVQPQLSVPPQASSICAPHEPFMPPHVFGVQHMPETQMLVPEHEQSTSPQELLTVVPQAPLHVGSWQQALLTHVDPDGQLNV